MLSAKPLFALLCLGLLSSSTQAAVSWSFDYGDSAEFDTSPQGLARRASLESAAAVLGSWFSHTATVTIAVTSSNEVESSTLASAGSNYGGVFAPGFGSSGFVRNRILTGAGNPSGADGTVNVNFAHDWDLDDDIGAESFDFKSTMIHELLHAAGFISEITANGSDTYSTAPGTPAMFSLFDKFLTDATGNSVIDPSTFILNGALWASLSVGSGTEENVQPGGIYFSGPNAMAANNGLPVRIFSPDPWQEGSSGSHLDDLFYEGNLMMKAATTAGPGARTLTAFEKGILQDLGYTMAGSTPPPTGSPLALWKAAFFGAATLLTGDGEDFDGDGMSNLLEFAIGTNPALIGQGAAGLEFAGTFSAGGTLLETGQPIVVQEGEDRRALYVRRKDLATAGVTYQQRFSADLVSWQLDSTTPAVLGGDATHEVVSVPLPEAGTGGKVFFRLQVGRTP